MSEYVLKQFKATDDESKARAAVQIGMHLYGYCCGYFGRDSYGKKRIVDIGADYICVTEGPVHAYNFCNTKSAHFSWVNLLESSNGDLEDPERNWNEED